MNGWRDHLQTPALPEIARFPSLPRLSCVCRHLPRVIPAVYSATSPAFTEGPSGLTIENLFPVIYFENCH
jgi:hypothetical protein